MYLDRRSQRHLQQQTEAEAAARRSEEEEAKVQRLVEALAPLDSAQLLEYLELCIRSMTELQRHEMFEKLIHEAILSPMSPSEVLVEVQKFYKESLARQYYAPFNMNSQNYNWVPPETETWFSELATWLDRCCELVTEGHSETAKQGLDLLMELVEKMNDGEEIVFAHEYGDWMIVARYDYQAVYQQLS